LLARQAEAVAKEEARQALQAEKREHAERERAEREKVKGHSAWHGLTGEVHAASGIALAARQAREIQIQKEHEAELARRRADEAVAAAAKAQAEAEAAAEEQRVREEAMRAKGAAQWHTTGQKVKLAAEIHGTARHLVEDRQREAQVAKEAADHEALLHRQARTQWKGLNSKLMLGSEIAHAATRAEASRLLVEAEAAREKKRKVAQLSVPFQPCRPFFEFAFALC